MSTLKERVDALLEQQRLEQARRAAKPVEPLAVVAERLADKIISVAVPAFSQLTDEDLLKVEMRIHFFTGLYEIELPTFYKREHADAAVSRYLPLFPTIDTHHSYCYDKDGDPDPLVLQKGSIECFEEHSRLEHNGVSLLGDISQKEAQILIKNRLREHGLTIRFTNTSDGMPWACELGCGVDTLYVACGWH